MDHVLTCRRGGYVSMRHNALRDMEANFLKEVCKDVNVEPELLPVCVDSVDGNTSEKARLDISARGVWSSCQRSFFDVRVTNADASSQQNSSLKSVLQKHEAQKKYAYNRRVMEVEHGSYLHH